MNRTPESISKEYNNQNIDKSSAIKQLFVILENSDRVSERLQCIKSVLTIGDDFENIGYSKDELYNIFESLLISDMNDKIRSEAATIIFQKFSERALNPLSWALHHDISPYSLTKIINSLIKLIKFYNNSNDSITKAALITEINQMEEKDFRIACQSFSDPNTLDIIQLGEILVNYYTIIYLKKLYWRLKYSVKGYYIIGLDFIFKGLTSLPEPLKHLKFLKTLILRYNQILRIPTWIGSLKNLAILNLNINNISELPDSIGDLKNLKELLLWKNNLKELPNAIGSLHSLEILNLRLNQINKLPETIGDLSKLQQLDIHDNKLIHLPENLVNLESLKELNLSWNLLKSLPDTMGNLKTLQVLNLEKNELESVPQSISNLSSLEVLNLCDNNIKRLPESIGCLKSLRILNISRNQITNLPRSMKNLNSLQELFLWDNKIEELPNFLKDLQNRGLKIYL